MLQRDKRAQLVLQVGCCGEHADVVPREDALLELVRGYGTHASTLRDAFGSKPQGGMALCNSGHIASVVRIGGGRQCGGETDVRILCKLGERHFQRCETGRHGGLKRVNVGVDDALLQVL